MFLIGENIGVRIGTRHLFSGINIAVETGSSLAIIGPSGSGKTTLLNCLGLIRGLTEGRIIINGHDFSKRVKREVLSFWRNSAAFIYQDSGVIDDESILYNVVLKRHILHAPDPFASEALSQVGLKNREKENAAVLSGGEKQRLGVARAIFKHASIIFADEPTASLDQANRELVCRLLHNRVHDGAIVVMATHDLELARSCDQILDLGALPSTTTP